VNKKQKYSLKKKATNFFGAIGYFLTSIQWLWVVLLYSSLIVGLAKYVSHGSTNQAAQPASSTVNLSSSVPMIIITAVIIFIMIVITIYIIIKIPSTLMQTSKKVAQNTAKSAAPIVLQVRNKKETKTNLIKLTPFLTFIMKIILISLPIILAYVSQFIENQVFDFFISMYVAVLLACFSLLFFVFQYLAGGLMLVRKQDIW
jgi:hypothetical protein